MTYKNTQSRFIPGIKSTLFWSLFASVVLANNAVLADATIQIATKQDTATLKVQGKRVLITSSANASEALFDSTDTVLYVIDHKKKSVSPINKQVMQQLSTQINSAMSALEKQLASMPPEQRAQMEQFMGGMGISTKKEEKPAISLLNDGSSEYASIACDITKVMQESQQIGTICITKGNNTELSNADYETLLELQTFMLNLAKEAGQFAEKFGQQLPSFGNTDLKTLVIHSEQVGVEGGESFSVTSINQDKVKETLALPEGYQTEDITRLLQ